MRIPYPESHLRSPATSFARNEDGGATIWNLTWLLGFAIMAGVSIDSTNGWRNKTIMQSTADAAALAAAIEYSVDGDLDKAKDQAEVYTLKNMPQTTHGTVLEKDADVVFGNWNTDKDAAYANYTDRWTPADEEGEVAGGLEVNAVQVTLRRTTASGNPVPMQMLHMIGWDHWGIQATAIAITVGGDDCWNNGFISAGRFVAQSNNAWLDDICIHGEERVEFGSGNYGEDGVLISTEKDDQDGVKVGGGGSGILEGSLADFKEDHVEFKSMLPPYPDMIPEFYNQLKSWKLGDEWPAKLALPFTPTSVVTGAGDVKAPKENAVYISTGTIKFSGVNTLQNVAAISSQSVLVDSSVKTVRNAVFLAHKHKSDGYHDGNIEFPSTTQVGDVDYCGSGNGWVRAWAGREVKIQSNVRMNGIQIVAGENAYVGSNGVSASGIAVQVGSEKYRSELGKTRIEPASGGSFGGCAAHFVAGGTSTIRLVF